MPRRRRRRGQPSGRSESHRQESPKVQSGPPAPTSANAVPDAKGQAPQADAFRPTIERAAAMAKNTLASKGSLGPMAFFVHEDGAMSVVDLTVRDDLHREALAGRIKEKALVEKASAVLVLTEAEPGRHGRLLLSGITPGISLCAQVDYAFDKEKKAVTSWQMRWLDRPVQSVFLDRIFDEGRTGGRAKPS